MRSIICFTAFMALALTASAQTTTQVTLFFLGFTGTGNVSSFSLTGAGSMAPLGAPKVVITGGTGSTFIFTFTFIPSGDTLNASCSNATHTTGTVGVTATDNFSGTATVSGGTGAYAQASGSFTFSMSVTPATAQSNISFSLSGSGSITTGGSSTGGGGTGNQPSVAHNGILNAASDAFVGLPNSSIAQGSIFTIYGTNMGPTTNPSQTSFPLQPTLGGVSVKVTSGGTSVSAVPVYVGPNQVNAILPSNTPIGSATLTVTYNGQTSAPASFQVVASSPGLISVNSAGSGPGVITDANTNPTLYGLTYSAHPGDVSVMWATGLGPVQGNEFAGPLPGDMPNLGLQVYVGGIKANLNYRGRSGCCVGEDEIVFTVPSGVLGCHVPVAVLMGNIVSNFVTMSIAPVGTNTCSDPTGPTSGQLGQFAANGAVRIGIVGLNRSTQTLSTSTGGTQTTTTDAGVGAFDKFNFQQLNVASNPFQTFTFGACLVYTFRGGSATTTDVIQPTWLDAGSALTVTGPNGTKQLPKKVTNTINGQTSIGYYASLGSSASGQQLYLSPGSYTLSGPGGPDVGAFSQNLTVPASLTWTNRDSVSTIDRAAGQRVTWTGGDPNSNVVIDGSSLVLGTALDGSDSVGAFFSCTAKQTDLQFTIPAVVLLSLPATQTIGPVLLSGALTIVNQITFPVTIPNVDYAFIGFSASDTKSVNFQ
jgi:uncharacterized protein (TIGR03437 family)